MNFKFLTGETDYLLRLEPIQQLTLTRQRFEDVEFCFQFGDGEPVVFGSGSNECTIRLSPQTDANVVFTDSDGRVFKLFARERQND